MKKIAFLSLLCMAWVLSAGAQTAGPATSSYAGKDSPARASTVPPQDALGTVAPPAGLLELPHSNDPGVQKAAQLIEQMVTALGGQAYLQMQTVEQSGRTFSFSHGESSGAGAMFWRYWKWPDKERIELTKQRDWYLTYNGDHAYETTFRGISALQPEVLADYLRRREHSLPWVLRKWLRQPGVALFYDGSAMAERKQADKVEVMNAQDDGVVMYIDSRTHLPLKIAFTWRDLKTRDRIQEAEGYDNYRMVQGIMTPFNITLYRDDQMVSQRFITETKYDQTLADSLFDAHTKSALQNKK